MPVLRWEAGGGEGGVGLCHDGDYSYNDDDDDCYDVIDDAVVDGDEDYDYDSSDEDVGVQYLMVMHVDDVDNDLYHTLRICLEIKFTSNVFG